MSDKIKNTECTLSDLELADKCDDAISKMCKTGGRSFTMSVPVNFDSDTDMILTELIKRFRKHLFCEDCQHTLNVRAKRNPNACLECGNPQHTKT